MIGIKEKEKEKLLRMTSHGEQWRSMRIVTPLLS